MANVNVTLSVDTLGLYNWQHQGPNGPHHQIDDFCDFGQDKTGPHGVSNHDKPISVFGGDTITFNGVAKVPNEYLKVHVHAVVLFGNNGGSSNQSDNRGVLSQVICSGAPKQIVATVSNLPKHIGQCYVRVTFGAITHNPDGSVAYDYGAYDVDPKIIVNPVTPE